MGAAKRRAVQIEVLKNGPPRPEKNPVIIRSGKPRRFGSSIALAGLLGMLSFGGENERKND